MRESEQCFRRLADQSVDLFYRVRLLPDRRFEYVSPASAAITGYTPQEFYADPDLWRKLLRPEDLASLEDTDNLTFPPGQSLIVEIVKKDGSICRTEHQIAPVLDERGRLSAIEGLVHDVSGPRQAEQELRSQYRVVDAFFRQSITCLVLLDRNLRFIRVNEAFAKQFQARVEDFIGRGGLEIFPDDESRRLVEEIMRTKKPVQVMAKPYKFPNQPDRETSYWDWILQPVLDEQGEVEFLFFSGNEVTERQRFQEQFLQAQRLESVGRLAGGVAHDFNNLLTIINGYSAMLADEMPAADPKQESVREIRNAGEQAAQLTRQLLALSRKQVLQPRLLDINQLLEEMRHMLARLVGEDVNVDFAFEKAAHALVRADPTQLQQVVLNIVVNARDAMPEGGRLLIETAAVDKAPDPAPDSAAPAHGWVRVSISDSGTGMDDATLQHMFEPFFTTKESGKGTGLGLAAVQGIIQRSGGRIDVQSRLGVGTTFRIYLPQVAGEKELPAEQARTAAAHSGRETVLVVEDQTEVRNFLEAALLAHGYKVLKAADAAEALLLEQQTSGPIDVLLTDLIMPGMSGIELARKMCERRSALKVLYMSGYTADRTLHHKIEEEGAPFLQKPFSPEELAAKLREVCASRAAA